MTKKEDIPVVILCGGRGTRLKEETVVKPKPLVEIGNYPILWHIMKIYSFYGFNNFILCLGYKGEMIKEYFCDNKNKDEKWRIALADTGETALKGARLKRIEKYVKSDTFMVTYGDGLANINISNLLKFHLKHKRIGTLSGVRPPSRFGRIKVEGDKVLEFSEKPQLEESLINGGFFVFSRRLFDYLSDENSCDFEIGVLDKLAKEGELMVYKHLANWLCMDNIRDTEYLNKLWISGKAFWKVWR